VEGHRTLKGRVFGVRQTSAAFFPQRPTRRHNSEIPQMALGRKEMLANVYPWSRLAVITTRILVCHYEDQ
jgi:hypothetical protein